MKKESQPIKVINIMKSGRIVEDMSTVTIPPDIYENVMRIFAPDIYKNVMQILLTRRQMREREAEAAAAEGRASF